MGVALKFIPRVGEIELNKDLKDYLETFVQEYFEKLLASVGFASKTTFNTADLLFIA